MSFSINCLEITAKKYQWKLSRNLYKNLLSEEDYEGLEDDSPFQKRFFFNDFYEHNQEGVLEKSSNSFNSDLFFGENINIQAIVGKNGSGKSTLMDLTYMLMNNFACMFTHIMPRPNFFARGLHVKLYFNMGSIEYVLECDDSIFKLYLNHPIFYPPIYYENNINDFKPINDNRAFFIARKIFYTIVTNYSILSLIPSSYSYL